MWVSDEASGPVTGDTIRRRDGTVSSGSFCGSRSTGGSRGYVFGGPEDDSLLRSRSLSVLTKVSGVIPKCLSGTVGRLRSGRATVVLDLPFTSLVVTNPVV